MKTALPDLAAELSTTDRTLRRALLDGLIHGKRPSPRTLDIQLAERVYLTRAWPLLSDLRAAMRTEPSLRLAVLFGSQARGTARPSSDIDVLVRVNEGVHVGDVQRRLEEKLGMGLHVVPLDDARRSPLLLAEVLRDGRALVDRDGDWPELKRGRPSIERAANAQRQRVDEAFAAAFPPDDAA